MGIRRTGFSVLVMFIVIVALGLTGCGSGGQAVKKAEEAKEPVSTVKVNMLSSGDLNFENKAPHSVVLCLYQLSSPGPFSTKRQTKDGMGELLSCSAFDSSVLSYERFIIRPASKKEHSLRRVGGADYLGVVAGYFDHTRGKTAVWVEMDNTYVTIHLGKSGIKVSKTGESRPLN